MAHQLDIKEPAGRGSTFIEVVYGRSTVESKPKTKNPLKMVEEASVLKNYHFMTD